MTRRRAGSCRLVLVTDRGRQVLPAMRKNFKKLTLSTTTLRALSDASLDAAAGAGTMWTLGGACRPSVLCITQRESICYAC